MSAQLSPSSRWTDAFLEAMRQATDPLADEVVRQLFEQGEVGAVNKLMAHLVQNDGIIPEALPPCIQDYLKQSESLPEWADFDKIRLAEKFFGDYGLPICLSLLCGSLPESYAGAKGVQVLYLTARLETDTRRRIGETAQMIINALAPEGLSAGGQGIRDVQKVRLMHAAIRHLVLHSGQWNPEWGQPINQEDMAGTLMTFTVTILDSLARLEVSVESEEAEAYLHAWKVIGHLLGLREDVMPDNVDDAHALMSAVRRRQFAPSEAGQAMAAALIAMMEEQVPGTLFDDFPATMFRHLLGDEIADMLAVPKSNWTAKLIGPCARIFNPSEGIEQRSPTLDRVGEFFTRAFLEGMAWLDRGGNRAPFFIPTGLQQQWQIKSHPGEAATRVSQEKAASSLVLSLANLRPGLLPSLLVASGILLLPVIFLVRPLANATAPLGIVSFELAGTVARAQEILASWSFTNRLQATSATAFDPLFLLVYSTAMALACVWAAGVFRARNWAIAVAGVPLAWGQWLATAMAVIQDIALTVMLLGTVTTPWPQVATAFAIPKYALLGSGLMYVLLACLVRVSSRQTNRVG